MHKRSISKFNPGAAGCGKFDAKSLLAHFEIFSESVNSKSEISKLITFPALKSDAIRSCIRRKSYFTLYFGCFFLLIVSDKWKRLSGYIIDEANQGIKISRWESNKNILSYLLLIEIWLKFYRNKKFTSLKVLFIE